MQLFYEGTDITRDVDVVKCIHRDVSGGRCDSMEIELEHAQPGTDGSRSATTCWKFTRAVTAPACCF